MGITMKVRVKLFGLLPGRFPGYDSKQGIEIDLPEDAMVKDLLTRLVIPQSQKVIVTVDGKVLKMDNLFKNRSDVFIFQGIAGG